MKKLFKKTTTLIIILGIVCGINAPVAQAVINNNIINQSWIQLDFDGVDEAGKTGANPTFNTNTAGTVACWARFDTVHSTDGFYQIFAMGGDDTDQATSFGNIFFGLRRSTSPSIVNRMEVAHRVDNRTTVNRGYGNTTISANTNYLFALSSSGTSYKMYVNNTLQSLTFYTGSNTGDWFDDIGTVGDRRFALGNNHRDGVWGTGWLDGKIAQCSIWSTQLTDANITTLYNGGFPISPTAVGLEANLVAHYPIGEESGGSSAILKDVMGSSTNDIIMENSEDSDLGSTNYY